MSQTNYIEYEVRKAVNDGFVNQFTFKAGILSYRASFEKKYTPQQVIIDKRYCTNSQTIVYRITTEDGLQGFLIEQRYEDENYIPFG